VLVAGLVPLAGAVGFAPVPAGFALLPAGLVVTGLAGAATPD
jgi:hypothetical protein